MSQYWPWLLAGGVVIAVLAGYAACLLWQLRRQRQAEAVRQQAQAAVGTVEPAVDAETREHRLGAAESIRVLARCFLDGQVGASEAALRIAVLLDQPVTAAAQREQGQVFIDVADALREIPTHGAWKALPREARDAHRETMARLEADYGESMRLAARRLLGEDVSV